MKRSGVFEKIEGNHFSNVIDIAWVIMVVSLDMLIFFFFFFF